MSSLKTVHRAIQELLMNYKGSVVRQTDYYYLVSFTSVTNAVHAALDIQLLNKDLNRNKPKEIGLKIGVNAGVPVTRKQLIFEDTIKLAERMCRIVKGELIISAEVKELYKNENAKNLVENKSMSILTGVDEKFLTHLMDYAEESWNDADFNANNFVKRLGYSKSQLYRKMISLTGKSPNSFVLDYRLEEALRLLGKNTGNISEIAFATGFTSPSYFTKCFKKKFGVLPAAYLKTH
jgi:AraC-like DNA-binding protein